MDQLLDLSAKFHGHYMTKSLKQIIAEKDLLQKQKNEQVRDTLDISNNLNCRLPK